MTEWELSQELHAVAELLIDLQGVQASYIAIFLSGIFAFILAAHTAGDNLSRFQATISCLVFSLFSLVIGLRIVSLGAGINQLMLDAAEIQGPVQMARYEMLDASLRLYVASIVWSLGPITALAFMWSVRHPKTE